MSPARRATRQSRKISISTSSTATGLSFLRETVSAWSNQRNCAGSKSHNLGCPPFTVSLIRPVEIAKSASRGRVEEGQQRASHVRLQLVQPASAATAARTSNVYRRTVRIMGVAASVAIMGAPRMSGFGAWPVHALEETYPAERRAR